MKATHSKYHFLNLPVAITGSERGLSLHSVINLPLGILLLILGIILISLLSIILVG
jgi:hypothetical protein